MSLNKSPQPVFIFGTPRSGTTLLYRLIQRHPVFRTINAPAVDDVSLVESNFFARYGLQEKQNELFKYLLQDFDAFTSFRRKTILLRWWQQLFKHFEESAYKQYSAEQRKSLYRFSGGALLAKKYFSLSLKVRGAQRVVEKTPMHIFRLPEIFAAFPNAKCIYVMRHPIDIFSSYKKRATWDSSSWLRIPIETFIKRYKNGIATAQRWRNSHPDQMYIVRFEDLTLEPTKELERICAYLHIPYSPEMQTITKKERPNLKDHFVFEPITPSTATKNWRDYLSNKDAKNIEDSLSSLLEEFGYPRYSETKEK